ncbi:MAG: hypothetical protein F2806_03310 [Actinobacteria bacterium]|uniref:Unannotated protein n=1 Tax=freshwater metagenome TaxID=449393 RepID=A0A6J7FP61_9ZZZZ|nr:hypothetical protein [Actinomycetota bacterium]
MTLAPSLRKAAASFMLVFLGLSSMYALVATPVHATGGANTTYVSGVGDDVNACTSIDPCKTFAGAISKTAAGGTIIAQDSGGFGTVTVTKSITIDGSAVESGIQVSTGGFGVTVNAGPTDRVVLRGLDFYPSQVSGSCSSTPGTYQMASAVRVLQAGSVVIEDSRISFAQTAGILISPTSGTSDVTVNNVEIRNGCGDGVQATPAAGATASLKLSNTTISGFVTGVRAADGANVTLSRATLFGNGQALATSGTGSIDSSQTNNHFVSNGSLVESNLSGSGGSASRTWVSAFGDDANPCSRTAPCRTFAGAYPKTLTGGEINALDTGNFRSLTIRKSITIDASPVGGQVQPTGSSPFTSLITVDVPATSDVILRGLNISSNLTGGACSYQATTGLQITSARTVRIENSNIGGVSGNAINITPTSSPTKVLIKNSTISNACGTAIAVAPTAGQYLPVLIQDSTIDSACPSVTAWAGADVSLLRTTFTNNCVATQELGGTITFLNDDPTNDARPTSQFTYRLPDGRECGSISPQTVINGTSVQLPGADADCRTPGSVITGWQIPAQSWAFGPSGVVNVVDSQVFTAVLREPVVQIKLDANVAAADACLVSGQSLPLAQRTSQMFLQRSGMSVSGRADQPALSTTPAPVLAVCAPAGYRLAGWNTRGDGTGTPAALGSVLTPVVGSNENTVRMFAQWVRTS